MKQISAEIVADSISPQGHRITSFILTYPRFIHSELMAHRVFSRNSASSRAIPFEKMVKMVEEDPFIPIAWQKNHKGMQGSEYWTDNDTVTVDEGDEYERYTKIYSATEHFITEWLEARDLAVAQSYELNRLGVTKQLCNRLLEPFMWHTVLLTGTTFKNFFELRCPQYLYDYENKPIYFKSKKDWVNYYNESQGYKKDNKEFTKVENLTELEWLQINFSQAEIHIQALAEAMWDAMNESKPKELKPGQWHIPFGDKIEWTEYNWKDYLANIESLDNVTDRGTTAKIQIATARCARLSYMTFDGEIDYEKDLKLHDRLLKDKHCFDEKTEILTTDGWKYFTEISYDSLIAQVNVKTGEFCGFSKPTEIIKKDYSGKIYKYNAKNIDLFVTEGHKLLGVPINKSLDRLKSYESLEIFEANKKRIKLTPQANLKFKTYGEQELKMFSAPKTKSINHTDKVYLRGCLSGFFIGDGFRYSKNKVMFRLKKLRKIEYISKILSELSISYNITVTKDNVSQISFIDNGEFDMFYDKVGLKTIPYDINLDELFLYGLFDGLKYSDGSIKRNTWVYDTSSKILHDRILDLCPLIGLTGYSNPSYPLQEKCENQNTHYRISFTTNNHILINDKRTLTSKVEIQNYSGVVYCVEVPQHGIIVRRNGKTVITHNCSPFEHCAKAMSDEEYTSFIKGRSNANWNTDLVTDDTYEISAQFDNKVLGWCNNFKGFIQYRYLIENNYK